VRFPAQSAGQFEAVTFLMGVGGVSHLSAKLRVPTKFRDDEAGHVPGTAAVGPLMSITAPPVNTPALVGNA
jgi:hypothetical protein